MEKRAVEMTKDLNINKDRADLKKKHHCNQCNYSTANASHLKSHKLIHRGEKPFACSQCKYSCTQADSLKNTSSSTLGRILSNADNAIIPAMTVATSSATCSRIQVKKLSIVHSATTRPLMLIALGHTCFLILEKSLSVALSASFLVHKEST